MVRFSRFLAGLALMATVFACDSSTTIPDPPVTGRLTGHVSKGASPIIGATVSISGNPSRSAITNDLGVYTVNDLVIGSYTVGVTATGLQCASAVVNIQPEQTTAADMSCSPLPGTVSGIVRVDGTGQSGIVVKIAPGPAANPIATATTQAGGTYTIAGVPDGSYTVRVEVPKTTCRPSYEDVAVQSNQTTTANFDCMSLPGTIFAHVAVNTYGREGLPLTLTSGTSTVSTATTGFDGRTTFHVPAGTYKLSMTPPSGTTCAPAPTQTVTVGADEFATLEFQCESLPVPFVVNLRASYAHRDSGASIACLSIGTSPAREGAAFTTVWSGPGIWGDSTRSYRTSENAGNSIDYQFFDKLGTYTAIVTVTSSGVTVTATASITVTEAPGTCNWRID